MSRVLSRAGKARCRACLLIHIKFALCLGGDWICESCSKELDEAIARLTRAPYEDLGFWEHIEKSSK